jgi:hypothetical protein
LYDYIGRAALVIKALQTYQIWDLMLKNLPDAVLIL